MPRLATCRQVINLAGLRDRVSYDFERAVTVSSPESTELRVMTKRVRTGR